MKALAALSVALLVPFLLACSGSSDEDNSSPSRGVATLLAPADFRQAIAGGQAFVVNVHVPYEGEIANTTAFVPYDRIRANASKLPSDRKTPVYVYCRSGMMSAEAAQALLGMGYEQVFDLAGGMVAWRAAGLDVLQVPGRN